MLFLILGNLNDAVPECPRVTVTVSSEMYQIMYLKRTTEANVFEIEYKPREAEDVDFLLDELTFICGLKLRGGQSSEFILTLFSRKLNGILCTVV